MDNTAPIVLCGLGRVGRNVLEALRSTGQPIVVVDHQARPDDPRLAGLRLVVGDCQHEAILRDARVGEAQAIIIVTSDDLVNVSTAFAVRRLNPTARLVVRMFNESLLNRLRSTLPNTVALSVSALTAPLLVGHALTGNVLSVVKLGDQLLHIAEVTITEKSSLQGKPIAQLEAFRLQVLLHRPVRGEASLLEKIPGYVTLAAGDRLVVAARAEDLVPHLNSDAELLSDVRWAGWLRRQLRTVRQTLAEIDWLVLVAAALLILTLLVGTLVFHYAAGFSWGGALYQTVSVVATGAALKGDHLSEGMQTFISVLKILGAVLVAAFTAIFTQYLLRAKLGGALEARKIPDAGHVVVCGLGNVGYRCITELVRLGVPCVAIEQVHDSPFAATVRRMGVPVIIGNATVPEVLQQARAPRATAIIAASSSELVNLEIGLLAREFQPDQRVILRLNDPAFAAGLRETANIRYALAIPALAAPAFVAALYGDRVQGLFNLSQHQLLIVEIHITNSASALCGQQLRAAMIDYQFLPLSWNDEQPFCERGIPYSERLKPNDRLMLAIERQHFDALVKRLEPEKSWRIEENGSTIALNLSRGQAEAQAAESMTRGISLKVLPMD